MGMEGGCAMSNSIDISSVKISEFSYVSKHEKSMYFI
jgi:hypothetical protein